MITRIAYFLAAPLVVILGLSFQARATELTSDYLLGKWVVGGTECSDPSSEFVIFRDSGAIEDVRAKRLEAAGFWALEDDILVVHVVASPEFFHDDRKEALALQAFKDNYYAFRIRIVPFNMEPDKFGAVGLLGEQINKTVFNRCKA